jgi:DNA polymerase
MRAHLRRAVANVQRRAAEQLELGLVVPSKTSAPTAADAPSARSPAGHVPRPEPPSAIFEVGPPQRQNHFAGLTFEQLAVEASRCTRCPLHATRTNVVFGVGDPRAELLFVGEAPGHDEDIQGQPFVGRAGQLLTRIIEAMGRRREDVYICNVLKCRPPENRNPLPAEVEECSHFLLRQIEIIAPKVIVALGAFAVRVLLETDERVSRLRGRFHDFHGIPVMPTYHPAFLLRNPASKRDVWEDMKLVMAVLSGADPKRQ